MSYLPFKALPAPVAQSRLKTNSFALALIVVIRSIFTPYRQFRRGVIWFVDEYVQGRIRGYGSWANKSIWWIETILTAVTVYNIVEAYVSLQSPAPPPKPTATSGPQLTPARVSSPLTRAYPLQSSNLSSTPSKQTPTRSQALQSQQHPSSALARTSSNNGGTPARSSPLSASTARALDLPFKPRESTGLFYPEEAGASPSKVGRGTQGQAQTQGQSSGNGSALASGGTSAQMGRGGSQEEFIMVEREEKEWVDNVYKGIRGKGGKISI